MAVEVNNSEGILGFINDTVSAAFGAGGGAKKPQELSLDEKKEVIKKTTEPSIPVTKTPEPQIVEHIRSISLAWQRPVRGIKQLRR